MLRLKLPEIRPRRKPIKRFRDVVKKDTMVFVMIEGDT